VVGGCRGVRMRSDECEESVERGEIAKRSSVECYFGEE
jgi:hypothetical protein